MHRLIRRKRRPTSKHIQNDNQAVVVESNLKHAKYLHQQGQLNAAQKLYQQILNFNPDHIEANYLLGMTWIQCKDFDEAYVFLAKAAHLQPNNLAYMHNFGAITLQLGDYAEAIDILTLVIAQNPNHEEAQCNLGIAYLTMGQSLEAYRTAQLTLAQNPHAKRAQKTLLQALTFEYPAYTWQDILKKNIYPFGTYTFNEKIILQTISTWLKGNKEDAIQLLSEFKLPASPNTSLAPHQTRTFDIQQHYFQYLHQLVKQQEIKPPRDLASFFIIGDSQSLAYHNTSIDIQQQRYIVHAIFIKDIKMHHLSSPEKNPFHTCVNMRLNEIPEDSFLLFQISDFDLYHSNYFFAHAYQQQENIFASIQEITSRYIKSIQALLEGRSFEIYIAGPPAYPSIINDTSTKQQHLLTMTEAFNQSLKNQSLQAEFSYLDIYVLTRQDPSLFTDQIHLQPHALQIAINELYYSKNP